MADRLTALLALVIASALFGAVPHHTAFTRGAQALRPVFGPAPLPSFAFGPSALYDNPALLSGARGRDFALSGADLAHPLNAAASFTGSFLEYSAAGLGYSIASRDDGTEQAGVLGYSASGANLDIGINLRFMTQNGLPGGVLDDRLFALDFDAGFLYAFLQDRLFAGAACFNLMSTDFYDSRALEVSPQRGVKIQVGGRPLERRLITLFTEVRADSLHDFNFGHWSAGGGAFFELLPDGMLRPHLAALTRRHPSPREPENLLFAGLAFHLPRPPHSLALEYGAEIPVLADRMGRVRHTATLGFNFLGRADHLPPVVNLRADNEYFTPNGDGQNDKVHLFLDASDKEGAVRKWALLILRKTKDGRAPMVKAWTGSGLPPRVVEWDGRDSAGELVEPGDFLCQFRVTDRARNFADSPPVSVKIP